MNIVRGRTGHSELRKAYATGNSWADPVLGGEHGVTMGHVFFEPRARTYWHSHERGQILIVTSGTGLLFSRSGEGGAIAVGDTAFIPPGEEHWHGAAADSFLVHVAISLGGADWLAEVTDAEYDAAAAGASH
jgi:quercetin dioxygenase-like cupin family protein